MAQILAASTFPEQVVEADRWVQAHPDLKGDALGQAVDQQPWDPSVKALTAFPSVLGNMDKNLSWTSSLGDAYYNQQQDVMDAVQVMRQRAQQAGNLKTTPQQTVSTMARQSSFSLLTPISFTSRPTIRGWSTALPSGRGLTGIPIPESGMAVLTSHSESALESASTAVSDGAGTIGDLIGTTTTPSITTTATTPGAPLSTTGTVTTEEEATTAVSTIAQARRPDRSTETIGRLAATLNRARRAARNQARSAVTTAVARQEAIRRAAAPASEGPMAAVRLTAAAGAGLGNRTLDEFLVDSKNL